MKVYVKVNTNANAILKKRNKFRYRSKQVESRAKNELIIVRPNYLLGADRRAVT